jgi:TRAP-type C4-dicarboxylate transport system permease small subunit
MVSLTRIVGWLRRRAENIAAALLAMVFISFILQITFRYVLGWPVGWTLEVSTLAWMWLVLWGAAFVVRERDEIRFDILFSAVSARLRRGFVVVTGAVLAGLFVISMPAVVDYVTFMRVESASYINLRLDYAFSIYVLFAVAVIARCLYRIWDALRGTPPETADISLHREE